MPKVNDSKQDEIEFPPYFPHRINRIKLKANPAITVLKVSKSRSGNPIQK
jgi:hypothetical protein